MTKVAVVFHSGYGHTVKQAEAIAKGANGTLVAIDAEGQLTDAQWDILQAADAIVFGSPTYMGSVTWQFKKFADTSSKAWFSQSWKNKAFGHGNAVYLCRSYSLGKKNYRAFKSMTCSRDLISILKLL